MSFKEGRRTRRTRDIRQPVKEERELESLQAQLREICQSLTKEGPRQYRLSEGLEALVGDIKPAPNPLGRIRSHKMIENSRGGEGFCTVLHSAFGIQELGCKKEGKWQGIKFTKSAFKGLQVNIYENGKPSNREILLKQDFATTSIIDSPLDGGKGEYQTFLLEPQNK